MTRKNHNFMRWMILLACLIPGKTIAWEGQLLEIKPPIFLPVMLHDSVYPSLEIISIASDGTRGDGSAENPAISGDGRYVAFVSDSTNLALDDTNGEYDIFLHDRWNDVTERISLASNGVLANDYSGEPAISADGRFVAFYSYATNLVPDDTNDTADIFVRDRLRGTTERISVDSNGTQADDKSVWPAISADGRFITFTSWGSHLVPGDSNPWSQVYIHDLMTGKTECVSTSQGGAQGNDNSGGNASVSADGRFVVFSSYATNLVKGDTNDKRDVFLRDRQTGVIEILSVSSNGNQGNNSSLSPTISADGRFVAFMTYANNFVLQDTNDAADVFILDRQTGLTKLVSVSVNGGVANGYSQSPAISADGRSVAFESSASDLIEGDTNNSPDIFVRDLQSGITRRVSIANHGDQSDSHSDEPDISGNGKSIAFASNATNLLDGEFIGMHNVYVALR